ncbi:MAG: hypothetical protein KKF48_03820, partial [Nanoarchaeota archaeon]|nr:hypothetical protein [Nanoarchaeota archaeon]MBU1028146.1 hypothetical protein [Nanoarchaeota archaeon]
MVYRKFIKRGDKIYGPYDYHSRKRNGKVITDYLGKHKKEERMVETFVVFMLIGIVFIAGFFSMNIFYHDEISSLPFLKNIFFMEKAIYFNPPAGVNAIFVDPTSQSVDQGDPVTIEIKGQVPITESDIYAIQFDVDYDPSILTFNAPLVEGDLLNNDGVSTIFGYDDSVPGKLDDVYISRNNTQTGTFFDGVFATISFTASSIADGMSDITLNEVIWVNSTITNDTAQNITPVINNGNVTVNFIVNDPPIVSNVECNISGIWSSCDTIDYGDVVQGVRATCIDPDGPVSSVGFVLNNIPDSINLIDGTEISGVGDVYTYDVNPYLTIEDSGNMDFTVTCFGNGGLSDTDVSSWLIDWGILSASFVYPQTDINVTQNLFSPFTSNLTCSGGECGDVDMILDPIFGNTDLSGGYSTITGLTNSRCDIFTLSEEGIVKNISRSGYVSGAGNCAMAIYDVSGNNPNNLIVQSAQQPESVLVNTWTTYPVTDTLLSPGDYALCVNCDVDYYMYIHSTGGIFRGHNADPYPFNDPFGSIDISGSYAMNLYAAYDIGVPGSKSGAVSTTIGAVPFYTSVNPQICSGLKDGDDCEFTWQVNATGDLDTQHEFYVINTPITYAGDVMPVDTPHVFINITLSGAPSCTDADGDGYNITGAGCGLVDCLDSNASINPGVAEICGDLVDNNCNNECEYDSSICSRGDSACLVDALGADVPGDP